MKSFKLLVVLCLVISIGYAQNSTEDTYILFTNVSVWDGTAEKLSKSDVLVKNNLISEVKANIKAPKGAQIIDGGGRTLMPGLIEAHAHLTFHGSVFEWRNEFDMVYVGAKSAVAASGMLMRGFTTAIDAGGPTLGLKKAIDEGSILGPRLYPSGPPLTQTGGHFDIRGLNEPNYALLGYPDIKSSPEWGYIVDGVPEVQKGAREVLRKGATQIKIMAGGGVATVYDKLDGLQFTPEELRAIVVECEKNGTYAMAHIYTSKAIQIALDAGVKAIHHGMLIDEPTMKMIKDKEAYLVPSFAVGLFTPEELAFAWPTPEMKEKGARIIAGMKKEAQLAKKYGVKLGFGTDAFGPKPENFAIQSMEFKARKPYFSNLEILKQATYNTAQLAKMCGPLVDPYKEGDLGEIKEGAYADILIVDGNPLYDVEILGDPEKNLKVIMKDGKIYKNNLN